MALEVKKRMATSTMSVNDINEEVLSASCCNCKHYYVAWDKDFPYGCKAVGFKSRTYPPLEVRDTSVHGRIGEAT